MPYAMPYSLISSSNQSPSPKIMITKVESSNPTTEDMIRTRQDAAEQLLAFKNKSVEKTQKAEGKKDVNQRSSSCSSLESEKKSTRLLPKEAVAILKAWLLSPDHINFPYPTGEEKKMLMRKTGLNSKQIKYWFVNARRRLWKQKIQHEHIQKAQQTNNDAMNNNECAFSAYPSSIVLNESSTKQLQPILPYSNLTSSHGQPASLDLTALVNATNFEHQIASFQQAATISSLCEHPYCHTYPHPYDVNVSLEHMLNAQKFINLIDNVRNRSYEV